MAYGLQNQKVSQSVRPLSCQASSEELKSVWFEAKRNLLQGSDWAMVSCSPAAVSNRIGISMKIFAQPGLIPCNDSRRGSLGKESLMKEARRGSAALIDIKPGLYLSTSFFTFFCIFAFFKCKTDWHQTKSFFSHCLCFVLMVNWDWGPLLSRHSVFCRFVAAVLFVNIRPSPFENTHAHIFVQSPALCCLQKKKCFNLYANKKYGCNASILLFQGPQSPVKSKTRGSSASLATKSQFRCS